MRKTCTGLAAAIGILSAVAAQAQTAPAPTPDAAARFGALEAVSDISLSPDGAHIAFIAPGTDGSADLYVVTTTEGATPQNILHSSGDPETLQWCRWGTASRLVCQLLNRSGVLGTVSTLVAVDAAGGTIFSLSARRRNGSLYADNWGGAVVDWLPAEAGAILVSRLYVPDSDSGISSDVGMAVERIDIRTGNARRIERPRLDAARYISDGHGQVRIMATQPLVGRTYQLSDTIRYLYRQQTGGTWQFLATYTVSSGEGFVPEFVDATTNRAIGYTKIDGRQAVVAMALDGSGLTETLFAHPHVDIDNILTAGAHRRVVGASFVTERRQAIITDGPLRRMTSALSRALGGREVYILDSTANDSTYLLWAGSDTNAGEYYLYTPATRQLRPLLDERPQLEGLTLSSVQPITYPAADGTMIPGYLTLPPGRSDARGLPAIVMPHGGPSARDEWGFDWMVQYFANQGYAVLQPNFRGSSGYGDAWYQNNGFQSWRTAIGDVTDAGRWLVSAQGADASKLSIVGWSYGGYAALQSGVLAPDLFRSIVAIAPVTDLAQLKREESGYVTGRINRDFIGSGAHIEQGSPARNAATIAVPVLMFHGTLDTNVNIEQSRTMRRELQQAGRSVELIEYPELAHNLGTSEARTDMLRRITAFLPH